jgi:hypothetical protein
MSANSRQARYALLCIGLAAFLAILPMLFLGTPWGHDFDLHIPAWMETESQFRASVLNAQWATGANYGFGEPFFVFYPPLSRMIAAVLGLLLPWQIVPGAYVWLVTVLAGMAMRKCASQWLDSSGALVAGLMYAVNPYLLVTAYRRSNYAELLASALFPLLLWACIRMGRDAQNMVLPLAVVLATIWLSDLPAAVIATYCVALPLTLMSFMQRSLRPILCGTAAIAGSFGSIAFFMLPAAWERRWVNIGEAVRPDWAPENNFLFSRHNLPSMLSFNRNLSFIALLLIAAAACAAVVGRRWRRDAPEVWYSLIALGVASALMMVSPSEVFYRFLPEMRYVGFPWRWLSPLCVVVVLLVVFSVEGARRKWMFRVGLALAVAVLGAAILRNASWDSREYLNGVVTAVQSGAGYADLATWSDPLGSQPLQLPKAAPLVTSAEAEGEKEPSGQSAPILIERWAPERKVFSVNSPGPLLLKIRLLTYPAWQGRLNGKVVPLETEQGTGRMLLPVPAGSNHVEITFVRTWDRIIGMIISLITILALALLPLLLRSQRDYPQA